MGKSSVGTDNIVDAPESTVTLACNNASITCRGIVTSFTGVVTLSLLSGIGHQNPIESQRFINVERVVEVRVEETWFAHCSSVGYSENEP
jgi:hypothetical protein